MDLLFEKFCPTRLHNNLNGPTDTASLRHLAAKNVHLAKGSTIWLRTNTERHRCCICCCVTNKPRGISWCYLELLEDRLWVQIDGAMNLNRRIWSGKYPRDLLGFIPAPKCRQSTCPTSKAGTRTFLMLLSSSWEMFLGLLFLKVIA